MWNFLVLLTEVCGHEFSFRGVQTLEICGYLGGDLGNYVKKMILGVGEAASRAR